MTEKNKKISRFKIARHNAIVLYILFLIISSIGFGIENNFLIYLGLIFSSYYFILIIAWRILEEIQKSKEKPYLDAAKNFWEK